MPGGEGHIGTPDQHVQPADDDRQQIVEVVSTVARCFAFMRGSSARMISDTTSVTLSSNASLSAKLARADEQFDAEADALRKEALPSDDERPANLDLRRRVARLVLQLDALADLSAGARRSQQLDHGVGDVGRVLPCGLRQPRPEPLDDAGDTLRHRLRATSEDVRDRHRHLVAGDRVDLAAVEPLKLPRQQLAAVVAVGVLRLILLTSARKAVFAASQVHDGFGLASSSLICVSTDTPPAIARRYVSGFWPRRAISATRDARARAVRSDRPSTSSSPSTIAPRS